jgi:hypothetical protein
MALKFLDKTKVFSFQIFGQAFEFLVNKYEQSTNVLTPASPFSMILTVVSEITELIFLYIENVASESNIATAKSRDNIYGKARLTGHNPTRAISAVGKIQISIHPGAASSIIGNYVIIPNYSPFIFINNNVNYMMVLPYDQLKIDKLSNEPIQINIIQGVIFNETRVATGEKLESYSIMTKDITDHFNVKVTVNGTLYKQYDSIYDMIRDEEAVVVKTGISGGIDVYFGNGQYGKILDKGALIKIQAIKSLGSNGNLKNTADAAIKYTGDIVDEYGNSVDLNKILYTAIVMPPSFGSDPEDVKFTKLIAPLMSKSFTLASPESYTYFLRKYDYFSVIDAYNTKDDNYINDDNIVYLFALPDVTKRITSDSSYFYIDEKEFYFSDLEKQYILSVVNDSGQQQLSTELRFVDPTIKRYAINIVLKYFDTFDKTAIEADIYNVLNQYFLSIKRRDNIPKSDLIALVESINGVDSVNISFISQANEEAIANGYYYTDIYAYDPATKMYNITEHRKMNVVAGTNPNLGLDDFGDIVIGERELPIIRGGWYDRDGNFYETYPDSKKLSSVNVIFKDKIPYDFYNKLTQQNIKKITA